MKKNNIFSVFVKSKSFPLIIILLVMAIVTMVISSGVTAGAPISAIPLAFWLYLLPLWRLAWSLEEKGRETPRAEMHEATPGEPDGPAPEPQQRRTT